MGLFGNNKKLPFRSCGLRVHHKSRETKLSHGLGRSYSKPRVIELKVPSIVTFHWLSYGSLPLAELLRGKEESFLLPAKVLVFLVGSVVCVE